VEKRSLEDLNQRAELELRRLHARLGTTVKRLKDMEEDLCSARDNEEKFREKVQEITGDLQEKLSLIEELEKLVREIESSRFEVKFGVEYCNVDFKIDIHPGKCGFFLVLLLLSHNSLVSFPTCRRK
jgi:chromosome segregation ATPase